MTKPVEVYACFVLFKVGVLSSWIAVACRRSESVSGMLVAGDSGYLKDPILTPHDQMLSSSGMAPLTTPPTWNADGFKNGIG